MGAFQHFLLFFFCEHGAVDLGDIPFMLILFFYTYFVLQSLSLL